MQSLLNANDDLVGGQSSNPVLPSIVSLDLLEPLRRLNMYTNTLNELAAPHELCVQKALELISRRCNYELNLATFRMELMGQCFGDIGEADSHALLEVNALIKGIECLAEHLQANFDTLTKSHADFFPYEYYTLHQGRYLFLSKIVFDANLSLFRPAPVAKPAYTYPEVQARHRADYTAQTDQCIML